MKWTNLSGQEVESNDNPATISALEKAGWKKVEEKATKKAGK